MNYRLSALALTLAFLAVTDMPCYGQTVVYYRQPYRVVMVQPASFPITTARSTPQAAPSPTRYWNRQNPNNFGNNARNSGNRIIVLPFGRAQIWADLSNDTLLGDARVGGDLADNRRWRFRMGRNK